MTSDQAPLKGIVRYQLYDRPGGRLLASGIQYNQIKNTGKAEVAKLIGSGLSGTAFSYLAIGTDNTANSASQTTLVAEITTGGGQRAAATVTNVTTTVTNDTARFTYQWTFSSSFTVQEAGILNAASNGVLLGRVLIGPISVVSGNLLTVQYDIVAS